MSRFHTHEWDFYPEDAFRPCAGTMRMHGGKGGGAPPPDPRLQYAQIEAQQAQTDIAQRMMANQTQLMPLQREALQFGLDSSKTAYAQSQQDREYALKKRGQLDAAMQPMLDEATNFNEDARRAQLATEAGAQITTNFSEAANQQSRGLARAGITMRPEQVAEAGNVVDLAQARARTSAGLAVSSAAKAEGVQARGNVVNMLGGFGPMASGLTTTGAQLGQQATNVTNAGVAGVNSGLSAANQIFGQMGQQSTGLWNAQASAKYTADKAANDASSQTWGAVIGAVAMVAMSDRRLKRDIQRVGTSSDGIPIYTFRYIGSQQVYTGCMADEVAIIRPEAVKTIAGYLAVDYAKLKQ